MHHQQTGRRQCQRHRSKIAQRVKRRFLQQRHGPQTIAVKQQRIAIGRRLRHQLASDNAAGTATIVDDHRLFKALTQTLRNQTRREVETGTGLVGHDAYGLERKALRLHARNRQTGDGG